MADRPDARPAPLLELRTLVERPQIAIDGTRYDILSPEELSVTDLHRMAGAGLRLEVLGAIDGPSQAEQDEMLALIGDLASRIMVGVPEDVRAKLPVDALSKVIEVFTGLLSARTRPAGGKAGGAARSTGASRRQGSSASTAATRAGGSRKPRSRS